MTSTPKVVEKSTVARELIWPVTAGKDHKAVTRQLANVIRFLEHWRIHVRRNVFTGVTEANGEPVTDLLLKRMWASACAAGLQDDLRTFHVLVDVVADREKHHPVCSYLHRLQWDGKPRVAGWLSTYVGAEDTPLHDAFGRAWLLGAVRRVMFPGCKFDLMLVLEGPKQGEGKSTVAAIMGGAWFTDNLQVGQGAKETIELTRGKWIVETPELSGMSKRDVEAVKAQVSRQVDRARAAYGYVAEDAPRQFVLIGTTNHTRYLKDPTGNRRFMPVRVGKIDLAALGRDRDQLWAEACFLVTSFDAPANIPPELWPAAAEAQEQRRVVSWAEEQLSTLLDGLTGIVAKKELWDALGIARPTQEDMNTLTRAMERLGWQPGQRRLDGKRREVYTKASGVRGLEEWLFCFDGELMTREAATGATKEFSNIFE